MPTIAENPFKFIQNKIKSRYSWISEVSLLYALVNAFHLDWLTRSNFRLRRSDNSPKPVDISMATSYKNALTLMNIEPSLHVCGIAHCTGRAFETKYAGKPNTAVKSIAHVRTSRLNWQSDFNS